MKKPNKMVLVAMSGGVDSSVAALLLKNEGYDVVGVFMRCFNLDGCAERDAEDARQVAAKLEIPFYVWDFEEEYKKRVVNYMVDGYRRGITPNPDVMCNKEIKFGLFFEKARSMGADCIATGHYVKLATSDPAGKQASNGAGMRQATRKNKSMSYVTLPISLFEAKDKNKDQSYFLWTLTQEQLKHCLFPIGDFLKSEVRETARKAGLPTAEKKDSQGICFLGKVALAEFLKEYIPPRRGEVVTTGGEKIGEHDGAYYYTIGQRHGLGVGGGKPYYVAAKDVNNNILTVAEGSDNPALYKEKIELTDVNFISPNLPGLIRANGGIRVFARVRYRQPLEEASLIVDCDKRQGGTCSLSHSTCHISLKFDQPVKFVAPGQSAVFYSKKKEMLGGGVIM
jgi:tRNA-specific 2-thiouridylase